MTAVLTDNITVLTQTLYSPLTLEQIADETVRAANAGRPQYISMPGIRRVANQLLPQRYTEKLPLYKGEVIDFGLC